MWWMITGWMFACGDKEEEQGGKRDWTPSIPAVLVKAEVIQTGSVTDTIEITGALESIEQVNLIPETTGVVQEIFVREGDTVQKGSPLAKIINTTANASLERSEIEFERIEREWTKVKRLKQEGAISDREYQEVQAQYQTAQASKSEASANQQRSTLRSPIDGVVATVNIREGEVATTTQLFQIVQPEKLRLVASVPERDLSHLQVNQTVKIHAAYNSDNSVMGVVERIAPVVDPTTGSVRVFINVEEGQTVLRPGQFVKAQVEVARHDDTIVLPKEGVVYEDGTPIAYIVTDAPPEEKTDPPTEENTDTPDDSEDDPSNDTERRHKGPAKAKHVADRRILTIGFSDNRFIEVTEGVELGEQVITIGNHTLEDNSPITLELDIPKKETEGPKDEDTNGSEKSE